MPKTNTGGAGDGAPFQLPADLSNLTIEQLDELNASANAELDDVLARRDAADLPKLRALKTARDSLNVRRGELEAEQAEINAEFDAMAAEMAPAEEPAETQAAEGVPVGEVLEGEIVEPTAPQLVTASGQRPKGGAVTAHRDMGGLHPGGARLNPSLSGIKSSGPAQVAPAQQLAMTASVGLPGQVEVGGRIDGLAQLGDLFETRARSMADQGGRYRKRRDGDPYGGVQVASVRNDWGKDVFNKETSVDVVEEYIAKVRSNTSAQAMATMVAAGGWCAPAQIRYDFFNIACEDGMIDLPTFGVERGGINFPVSPSLADTFTPALPWYTAFSNATVPWLWTNGDDILAVTGSPTKPCIRVPCSEMSLATLECYGICLTAGNLADNAWPESTRNFLRLLMAAHYHASNARYISTISGLATAFSGCTVTGSGAAAPILATAELSGWDYRTKYGMCETDVIEWVLPAWSKGLIRADLAKRTGVDPMNAFRISDADIASWFDVRNIRAQFVQDYQVRAAGQPGASAGITSYPSTVRGLMYAAGTVARGNGMTLDLGVVRDSTLNATNDFTAAWMEECHLIARFGHEVREYTMNVCPDGTTGAADLTSCCP